MLTQPAVCKIKSAPKNQSYENRHQKKINTVKQNDVRRKDNNWEK